MSKSSNNHQRDISLTVFVCKLTGEHVWPVVLVNHESRLLVRPQVHVQVQNRHLLYRERRVKARRVLLIGAGCGFSLCFASSSRKGERFLFTRCLIPTGAPCFYV